jgi:hypothetical protein
VYGRSGRLVNKNIASPKLASASRVPDIVHAPCAKPAMRPESRDALLTTIATDQGWIEDVRFGRTASFAEIAEREEQGELAARRSFLIASLL